jgi:hypothetical protein
MDIWNFKCKTDLSANPFANFDLIHSLGIILVEDFQCSLSSPKYLTLPIISPEVSWIKP